MYRDTWESHDGYIFKDELSYLKYTSNWEDYSYGPIGLGATRKDANVSRESSDSYEYSAPTRQTEYIITTVNLLYTTDKAYLFGGLKGNFWLPKSIVRVCEQNGQLVSIKYPDWVEIKIVKEEAK